VGDEDELLHELAFGSFDPESVALIEKSDVPASDFEIPPPTPVAHQLKSLVDGHNRLNIEIDSERQGILVVSDTYYPGWTAEVNGELVPILKINGGFRGVSIPDGTSSVEFHFRSQSLRWGAATSLFALVLLVGLCRFTTNHRKTSEDQSAVTREETSA